MYAGDLYRLGGQHRRYVQTLEAFFAPLLSEGATSRSVQLPPCDGYRRLLAVEYARLHWRLRTASKPDGAEDWWLVRVEAALPSAAAVASSASASKRPGPRPPQPLLSELCTLPPNDAQPFLQPPVGTQPRLRFIGVRGAGDEIYDLVDSSSLLGIRPGETDGEVYAFLDSGAAAVDVLRRLTGHEPRPEPMPIRGRAAPAATASAWGGAAAGRSNPAVPPAGAGLRVVLDQTASGRTSGGQQAAPASRPTKVESQSLSRSGPDVAQKAKEKVVLEEEVPETWEEAADD